MKVKIISKSGRVPMYATKGSAGFDLAAFLKRDIELKPGERVLVPTGIYLELPDGFEAQIRARSGLAAIKGIGVVNGVGTIDPDYRGEILVPLINWGNKAFIIKNGDRIAQAVINKFERADFQLTDSLNGTDREGGFGHTGV